MDLLDGYRSSSSEGGNGDDDVDVTGAHAQQSAETVPAHVAAAGGSGRPTIGRPMMLNAAPVPTIPAAMRAKARRMGTADTGPPVPSNALTLHTGGSKSSGGGIGSSNGMMLMNNPLKSVLHAPVQGPMATDPDSGAKPQSRGDVGTAVHNDAFDEATFEEERKRFQRTGRAMAPTATGEVVERGTWGHSRKRYAAEEKAGGAGGGAGSTSQGPQQHQQQQHGQVYDQDQPPKRKRERKSKSSQDAKLSGLVEGSDDEATYGIWGPPSKEERDMAESQITDLARGVDLTDEQLAERAHIAERNRRKGKTDEEDGGDDAQKFDRLVERKMSHLLPPRLEGEEPKAIEPSTIFHGADELDYRGRSWTTPPAGTDSADPYDVDDHSCYVPKKCTGRLTGHNKGVQRVRFFPRTGHLLLSAGLEGKCKVWSIPERKVMRTYIGHSAAVRDVQFSDDGSTFLSASFDRFVRLWNTETGEVLGTYTNRRVPYVVKFYPHDNNTFVVGCSDNKIVAYDSKSGEITQEYNHHLAPVNTITFVEDHGTKMVTSSDDKKVLVWEWDIGVPVKYISDPTMHSIPVITLHPTQQYWAGQSLDNQIVVYQARDRFALQRKKKFSGHTVAGYACDIAFSPDGRFLVSGDGDGKIYFWDWRRGKLLQKYRAHDNGPAIACAWHPVNPTMVVSAGWDGIIKIWE
eukprot:CAMPEP_0178607702 /NCGR_PEP_ID=MMETSP0697-20121206/37742_1 /TAXON_ID=265572 /ORGANISM="Extubocellulus spinifer, Strain CCMP396" /LENGTH=687 /DNA_ID=CAMNT_0020246205 /DNA_START=79 /DNA_END=2142 /DNA_ORIENTATION=-